MVKTKPPEREVIEMDIECDQCGGNGINPFAAGGDNRCIACIRTPGTRHLKFTIPRPGDKVKVRSQLLLRELFGEDEAPSEPGTVYDMQMPEEHGMELKTGYGIRVTWDRLTQRHEIPKGENITLWLFDLIELELVKK